MSILANGVTFDLGDGWLYAPESTTQNYVPGTFSANPLFLTDKNGSAFQPGVEYRFYAMHPILEPDPLLYGFKAPANGAPADLYPIISTGAATTPTAAPPAVTPELLLALITAASAVTPTHLASDLPTIGEMLVRAYSPATFRLICNGLASVGCSGGGSGSGGVTLSTADMLKLAEFDYQWAAWKEGRIDPATNQPVTFPAYPALSGGTPTTPSQNAVINANLSVYRDAEGLIIQANCSNGEDFSGRVVGQNGANPPSTAWMRLSRIDGTAANGTYVENFGFLPAGSYVTQVRIGVDNNTIVEKPIVVASTTPIGKGIYRIIGNLTPPENVVNEQYTLQEQYTDGTWHNFTGGQTWVLVSAPNGVPVPAGIGIAGGLMSGGADIISVDTPIVVRCFIGVNVELPITLKNTVGGTVPTPATQVINGVFAQTVDGVGRVGLANVTAPCEAILVIYKVVNGVEQSTPYSNTAWFAGELLGGTYDASGATVQHVWGYNDPTQEGTYNFYETWRPIATGDTDTSLYKRLPVYTVVVGPTQVSTPWELDPDFAEPAQNTIKYVQYRFVPSGNTGGGDLLEVQMIDGYNDQPMYIYFALASQAAPTNSTSNSYQLYQRQTAGNKLSPRSYQPASGQNLKAKSFKVYISTNNNTTANLLTLNIVTTNLATDGWVNLYTGS